MPKAVRIALIVVVTGAALLFVVLSGAGRSQGPNTSTTTQPNRAAYPIGITDAAQPSGRRPPPADALPGFTRTYATDFAGSALPSGWDAFSGVPSGVPGGQFATNHVVVGSGLLRLESWRDPAYADRWVTGGVCLCARPQTFGAYFVRSRLTGPGPNEIQLLWPASDVWPPEIDFFESGVGTSTVSAFLHYSPANYTEERSATVDLTKWHTFGVVWRRDSLVYTVDGRAWGSVTLPWKIPDVPMTLHLQQQTSCEGPAYWCPTKPATMQIDWVVEYAMARAGTTTRGT